MPWAAGAQSSERCSAAPAVHGAVGGRRSSSPTAALPCTARAESADELLRGRVSHRHRAGGGWQPSSAAPAAAAACLPEHTAACETITPSSGQEDAASSQGKLGLLRVSF